MLAISGSLREGSHNSALLEAAREALPADHGLEVFDALAPVPPYSPDDDVDPAPAAVQRLREAIAGADALLIATPEYNSSLPGQLKNAIDWASRPFPDNVLRGKPAAVVGATTGRFGAVWAQAEARKTLGAAGARVLDRDLPVGLAAHAFAPDGSLVDDALGERLRDLLSELADEVEKTAVGATEAVRA
ncbi:MAG: NAD(P)H-dependent oxidoreductase [Actinomycetota bacterium]|nr:NAD(P)H-dependent oxidoreductase [Actinomycetota bacterium]